MPVELTPNSNSGNLIASAAAAAHSLGANPGVEDAALAVKNISTISATESAGRLSTGRPSSSSSHESHQKETFHQGVRIATFRGFSDKLPHTVGSKVLMLLSIKDCIDCEKDYLRAQIQTAMEKGLEVVALMGDTLHWHNLKNPDDLSEQHRAECQKKARHFGEKYLSDNLQFFYEGIGIPMPEDALKSSFGETIQFFNQKAMEVLSQPQRQVIQTQKRGSTKVVPKMVAPRFSLVDWSSWCSNERYLACQSQLLREFNTVPDLVDAVNITVENFFKRHQEDDEQKARVSRSRSRDYVIDETMAIVWNALERGFDYLLYPKKGLISFEKAIQHFTTPPSDQNETRATLFFPPRPFGILSLSSHVSKGAEVPRLSDSRSTLFSRSPGLTPTTSPTLAATEAPPLNLTPRYRHVHLDRDPHVSSSSSGDEAPSSYNARVSTDTHSARVRRRKAEVAPLVQHTLESQSSLEKKAVLLDWLADYVTRDTSTTMVTVVEIAAAEAAVSSKRLA